LTLYILPEEKILGKCPGFFLFIVQEGLPVQQRFLALDMVRVGNAAVYRTNGSALRLFMETFAFGAFVWYDVVNIVRNGLARLFGVYRFARRQNDFAAQRRAVFVAPVVGAFVYSGIGALGLAGTAVDAFVGYNDGHDKFKSRIFAAKLRQKTTSTMTLDTKKEAFATLGRFLAQFAGEPSARKPDVPHNDLFFNDFEGLIAASQSHNGWYTPEQVRFAVASWAKALTRENLDAWLDRYGIGGGQPKTIGLVLAGNIPLVGFHDFIAVVLTGHKALVKLSSNDQKLLPFLSDYLIAAEPGFSDFISFTDGKLENFDAVIATGSNNTARYFEYYFRDKPAIIRKNRNAVAILTGKETSEELEALGEDIFRYFGLGCRNVSKLFVPRGYDFKNFFEAMYKHSAVIHYEKYANNYDYNKAVFLMSNFKILDNGFLTLKEDASYASPISSVFYEYYDDLDSVRQRLGHDREQIQCIVSAAHVPFGQSQRPELWDYADNVDTVNFLTSL
jgi:hypothetical protein